MEGRGRRAIGPAAAPRRGWDTIMAGGGGTNATLKTKSGKGRQMTVGSTAPPTPTQRVQAPAPPRHTLTNGSHTSTSAHGRANPGALKRGLGSSGTNLGAPLAMPLKAPESPNASQGLIRRFGSSLPTSSHPGPETCPHVTATCQLHPTQVTGRGGGGLQKDHPQKESFSPAPRAEPTRAARAPAMGLAEQRRQQPGLRGGGGAAAMRSLWPPEGALSALSQGLGPTGGRQRTVPAAPWPASPRPQAATGTHPTLCSSTGLSRQRTHTKAKQDHTHVPGGRSRLGPRAPCPAPAQGKQAERARQREGSGGTRGGAGGPLAPRCSGTVWRCRASCRGFALEKGWQGQTRRRVPGRRAPGRVLASGH